MTPRNSGSDLSSGCPQCGFLQSALPRSPCPDFLHSNHSPPDPVLVEVRREIIVAENGILQIEEQINHLQQVLNGLASRKQELQGFIVDHRRISSPLRRLPTELLSAIFLECSQTGSGASSFCNPAVEPPVTRVCRSWRAVILSTPRVWRRIEDVWCDLTTPPAVLATLVLRRLERSAQVPLEIVFQPASRFDETQRISLINALFSATHRWQNVSLHLTDFELRHFKLDQSVPQLRKLALVAPHYAHLGCFFRSLPALEDLYYGHNGTAGANTSTPHRLSSQLHDFPLPQLTRLSLWNIKCEMSDMLDVLQSAVNAVDIVMSNCTLHALQGSHHTQRILPNLVALDVHQSHADFLSHLSTPALQLLSLTGPLSRLPPALVSFTTQARASLTSLKLSHISGYDTPLLALLRTVPHLTRLRLLNTRSTGIHTSFIEALTITPAVFPLPRLASLELEGRFWCGTHPLMTMLRSRCSPAGALRTVRLFGGSELADVRGQSLGDEVEFVVRAGTAS